MTLLLALKIRIRVPKSNFSLTEPKNVLNIASVTSMRWDCLQIWWDTLICWLLLRLVAWCVADESASYKCFWCTRVIQSGSKFLRLWRSVASENDIWVNEIAIALSSRIICHKEFLEPYWITWVYQNHLLLKDTLSETSREVVVHWQLLP